jgi:hypothetical protein
MVHYQCPRCDFETDHRSNMKVHIERTTRCRVIKLDIDIDEYKDQILDRTFDKIYKILLENETLKSENKDLRAENEKLKYMQIELSEKKKNSMYIIQEREFFNLRQPVYKLGITETIHNRMGQYPKGSKIICIHPVYGDPEALCLQKFRTVFIPRTDIGSEYFQGDVDLMVKYLLECCS